MSKANTLKECFAILVSEYGDRLTPEQKNLKKELFNNVIGNYSPEKIKKMTMEMIKTRKYANFPKIAEMIELIEGNKEEETELAWAYLLKQANRFGYYYSISFSEYPAIGGFIQSQGGWVNFCDKLSDAEDKGESIWIKKEFEKSYKAFKGKEVPTYFEGYFELENTRKGYDNQKMIERYGMAINGKKKKTLRLESKNEKKN